MMFSKLIPNLFFLTLLMIFSSAGKIWSQPLPNIVIYLADDLSRSDISVYNDYGIPTPNLERLGQRGMTFNRAFVASPACAPSRAALFSGLMPARNGAEGNHTQPRQETLQLIPKLQELGYEVLSFGKTAHPNRAEQLANYGFDYIEPKRVDLPELVRDYFATRTSSKPVCLIVGDRRPHVRWTTEMDFAPESINLPPFLVDTRETREHWARYATDIKGMDEDLGKIMQYANDWFGDDHLFLFSADHGSQWPFGKWNLYDYGSRVPFVIAWSGKIPAATQTEAMISWIDIFPTLIELTGGEVPDSLDGRSFAGVLTEPGKSHREVIFTTHTEDGQYNVYPMRSVRTDRYKYILNRLPGHYHSNHSDINRLDGAGAYWNSWDKAEGEDALAAAIIRRYFTRPAEELYDLALDPMEQHNLAVDPVYQQLLSTMRTQLHHWMESQGDEWRMKGKPYLILGPRPTREMVLGEK